MFGQTGNTSFAGFNTAAQTSPFGQSAFGKPITTTSFGSGATPVFGSSNTSLFNSKPIGSTTGGLFGNTTTPPAFTQPSFGGFGTTNTNTNLFGTQQNASTNLFGTSTATSAFGQSNKPAGFSFGTTTGTNLFGQPQQSTQQTTPFGQSSTTGNTNLFGTTPGFGSTNTTTTGVTGTVVKFTPVITTDSMSKNGISHSISARHYCIVSMKEYESKSYEELRFEDYSVGRKGPSTGIFGTPAQPSPFGTAAAGTSTAATGFGGMSGGFGTTSQSGSTSLFGKSMTSFGTPSTTTTNSFAFNSTPSTNLFGSNAQAKPFGTAAPTPLFATSNTNQTAGTGFAGINTSQNTGFGSTFGSTQSNQSIGLFNQNKSAFNVPSTSSSTGFTGFGQAAASNTGTTLFGTKSTGNTGFGTTPAFGSATASTFGTTTGFTAGQNTGTSLFNTSFKPAGQTSFSFGSTSAPSTGLGTNTGLTLGGGSTLFGQQKPGGLFGNTGNNPAFNTSASFGSSAFGTNTNAGTGIGMGLFGAGAANTQTKSSGTVPVHQQILALVSAPFGDSPLLKNLLPASGKTEELLKPANAPSKILNGPQYKVTANNKSPKIKAKVVTSAQLTKKSMFEGLEEEDPLSEAFQPRPNAKRLVLRPKSITNSMVLSPNEKSQPVGRKGEERGNIMNSYVEDTTIGTVDKENHSQDNNRQLTSYRKSSSSCRLKTSLPRNSTTKPSDEESFDGQRSLFSGPNVSSEEIINNTVTELRPHANANPSNQTHSEVNNSADTSLKHSSLVDKTCSTDTAVQNTDSSRELGENSFSTLQTCNSKLNIAKVTLTRAGYYTIPPLDELEEYAYGETCVVPNFTVGREGYGNVYFPDAFDIYGLNLDDIVHFRHKEVIIYPDDEKKPPIGQGLNRKAQVTLDRVWPQDKSLHKPITDPQRLASMDYEEKLRRVSAKHDTRFLEYRPETGSWVFKVDHFSKYGLSDSDEDDNNVPTIVDPKRLKLSATTHQKPATINSEQSTITNKDTAAVNDITIDSKIGKVNYSDLNGRFLTEEPILRRRSIGDYIREKQLPVSPTGDNARILGTDSHKLQLMKASFFDGSDEEFNEIYEQESNRALFLPAQKSSMRCFIDTVQRFDNDQTYEVIHKPILRSNLTIHFGPSIPCEESTRSKTDSMLKRSIDIVTAKSSIYGKRFPDPPITPVTVILKWHSEVIPLAKSIIHKLESRSVADTGIQMGRMFKPSWGRGLTLLTLSTQRQATNVPLRSPFEQIGSYVCGRVPEDTSSVAIVQRIQIMGGNGMDEEHAEIFEKSIEGHLKIQLSHRIMDQEGDCPIFGVDPDIHKASIALHAHCSLAEEFMDQFPADTFAAYVANVWKLCVALWGTLPEVSAASAENIEDHETVVARREAIGEWLKHVIQKTLECENGSISNEEKILFLLCGFELEKACKTAREAGDNCLALLMAQLRSGIPTQVLIKQQIALWQDSGVDENVSMDRLKLFALIAGEPLVPSKHGLVNVCEGLDWKRALAVHLWYFSSPMASIRDTLELYEASFDTSKTTYAYAAPPKPEYRWDDYELEANNGKPIYDLCFHFLKLFCTGNHALGELLNPATHTADPLDYRLSWLVQQVLLALGYSHLSEHVATLTHVNFATQLEAYGLWHWAIFVMLHIQDVGKRRTAVMNLLQRHIEIDTVPDYIEREKFLREELGIPSAWVHQAKAVKSYVAKRYCKAASYFIQAEQWNAAHEIIIEHLAADAIINENYDYLRDLLSPMTPSECSSTISGWAHQGQLLWEYMEITVDIESLLRGADPRGISYKLELLKPRLTCLCLKINQFPCTTAKHRLCQAEIAKRTLHLARNLLQSNESTSITILQLVSQLPLPEDYAQQELRPIVNMRVNEMISQAV